MPCPPLPEEEEEEEEHIWNMRGEIFDVVSQRYDASEPIAEHAPRVKIGGR